jgi:hypothetical protein
MIAVTNFFVYYSVYSCQPNGLTSFLRWRSVHYEWMKDIKRNCIEIIPALVAFIVLHPEPAFNITHFCSTETGVVHYSSSSDRSSTPREEAIASDLKLVNPIPYLFGF